MPHGCRSRVLNRGVRSKRQPLNQTNGPDAFSDLAPWEELWAQLQTDVPGLLLAGSPLFRLTSPPPFQGLTLQPVMRPGPSQTQPCPPGIYWCPPLLTEGDFFQLKPPSSLNPLSICPLQHLSDTMSSSLYNPYISLS